MSLISKAYASDSILARDNFLHPIIGKVLDPLHVLMMGDWSEIANRHVFDHAPAQRADGLVGHRKAPGAPVKPAKWQPLDTNRMSQLRALSLGRRPGILCLSQPGG